MKQVSFNAEEAAKKAKKFLASPEGQNKLKESLKKAEVFINDLRKKREISWEKFSQIVIDI